MGIFDFLISCLTKKKYFHVLCVISIINKCLCYLVSMIHVLIVLLYIIVLINQQTQMIIYVLDVDKRHNLTLQVLFNFKEYIMFNAEGRLEEANRRLSEAQKQLSQAHIVISEIKNETIAAKKVLLKSDAFQAKKDLTTRFNRALATFRSKERQIFLEVKEQIILLVSKRTIASAQKTFGPKEKATALINETINKLEGDLL